MDHDPTTLPPRRLERPIGTLPDNTWCMSIWYGDLNGKPGPHIAWIGQKTRGSMEMDVRVKFTEKWGEAARDEYWISSHSLVHQLHAEPARTVNPQSLTCPNCGRECSSTSGFTLHTKGCLPRPKEVATPAATATALTCGICGKECSSTSGLTLHRKNKHPEVLAQAS